MYNRFRIKDSQIEVRTLVYDRFSNERSTGNVKPKYKLLVHVIPKARMWLHIVTTSKNGRTSPHKTLVVEFKDWESVTGNKARVKSLRENQSYICWDNLIPHEEDEIKNFQYVAFLNTSKWEKLKNLRDQIVTYPDINSTPKDKLKKLAITPEEEADAVARNLGLI